METGEELIRAMLSLDVSIIVIRFVIIVIALFFFGLQRNPFCIFDCPLDEILLLFFLGKLLILRGNQLDPLLLCIYPYVYIHIYTHIHTHKHTLLEGNNEIVRTRPVLLNFNVPGLAFEVDAMDALRLAV